MKTTSRISRAAVATTCVVALLASGCGTWRRARALYQPPPPAMPLGTQSDAIWKNQELNAAASEFVVLQHEFELNTSRLNMGGQDHVKQIASKLCAGQEFPVVIERSMTSVKENTKHKFPVNPNPKLDMQRREVVVRCLAAMKVPNPDERVSVAPAYVDGLKETEAERSYQQGQNSQSGYGFGGFGFGGFGGIGGFGGGF